MWSLNSQSGWTVRWKVNHALPSSGCEMEKSLLVKDTGKRFKSFCVGLNCSAQGIAYFSTCMLSAAVSHSKHNLPFTIIRVWFCLQHGVHRRAGDHSDHRQLSARRLWRVHRPSHQRLRRNHHHSANHHRLRATTVH